MKKIWPSLLFLILSVVSCGSNETLKYENFTFKNECQNCPKININLPHIVTTEKKYEAINLSINQKVAHYFKISDQKQTENLDHAIQLFLDDAAKLQEDFPDENTALWEIDIDGTVSYESKDILSIALQSFIFTGGAHGYQSITYLNFNKETAQPLNFFHQLKDSVAFVALAEKMFRAQEKIAAEAPINSTGFMFEGDTFKLPENIGYTEKGVLLLYNQYEIASYADGPQSLLIPFETFNALLKPKKD
jgi:hypothetical protein